MKKINLIVLSLSLLLAGCSDNSNKLPDNFESSSDKLSDMLELSSNNDDNFDSSINSSFDYNAQFKYQKTLDEMKEQAHYYSDNDEYVYYGSAELSWQMKIQSVENQDRPRLVGLFRTYDSIASVTLQFNEKPGKYPVSYLFQSSYSLAGSLYLDSGFNRDTKLSFSSFLGNESEKETSLKIVSLLLDAMLNQFTLNTKWNSASLGFENYSVGNDNIKNEAIEYPHLPDNFKVLSGGKIQFGNYPQSVVSNLPLKTALSNLENGKKIGSVLFYDGDNDGKEEEYAVVNCEKQYKADDGSKVETGIQYYKYEPITWISIGNNKYVSEKILDSQAFGGQEDSYEDDEYQVHYVYNQYETSSIRKWLNEDFLDLCFTKDGQKKVVETENQNGEKKYGNKTIYKNTIDKAFLLSKEEVETNVFANYRNAETTDYYTATSSKLRYKDEKTGKYYGDWWLRSPYEDGAGHACYEYCGGDMLSVYVSFGDDGIRPALTLSI